MNIPTAQEFIKSTELVVKFDNTNGCILEEELPNLLKNFAKLHVEAALKKASESRCINMLEKTWYEYSLEPGTTILARINITVDKDSILNSYPLTNIK